MKEYHLERLVYVCTCAKGKGPHIHWDLYTSQPERLSHVEIEDKDIGVPVPKEKKPK